MNVGDLVWFPCDAERYQHRVGIWMGNHDNKADVKDPVLSKALIRTGQKPRQVADILYKGKLMTCWAAHVKKVKND